MIEVQDIFTQYFEQYKELHKLSLDQLKAASAIINCRTSSLGGHMDVCDSCGYSEISYNSCKNRHCPKCQTFAQQQWVEAQNENLLNVGYFHIVFTVPDIINTVFCQNQRIMYSILFKAVSETLLELTADKKYLGAKIGITTVLHTWGQNLMYHPHLHCIVPGGGLTKDNKWVNTKEKFFLPVKVLSRKFRGKFIYYLRRAKLSFFGSIKSLNDEQNLEQLFTSLYNTEWVVYCKPPFKNSSKVIEYLGRYTHRVAISNNRITNFKDGNVTFKWRDYKDNNKTKLMTISADEFIRRFLMHVLPTGFMKIRHYGILASRNKEKRMKLCRKLTNTIAPTNAKNITAVEKLKDMLGDNFNLCPRCGVGYLQRLPLTVLPDSSVSIKAG